MTSYHRSFFTTNMYLVSALVEVLVGRARRACGIARGRRSPSQREKADPLGQRLRTPGSGGAHVEEAEDEEEAPIGPSL